MCRLGAIGRRPGIALPVCQALWNGAVHTFPPDAAFLGHRDVREYRVPADGIHRVGVRLTIGAWCDAEITRLGIDRPESAVRADIEPRDVLADGPYAPALRL